MRNRRRVVAVLLGIVILVLAACEQPSEGSKSNEERRNESVQALEDGQPAETMDWSPSIETINFWINTWEEPGKLSFVYIERANGEYGYFILEGLPVSYCAGLTSPWDTAKIDSGDDSDDNDMEAIVPAPGMDGVYYSGGQCNVYYGKDATTGAYVEWSIGQGQNYFLYDEPMPRLNSAQPLGPSEFNDVPANERDGVDQG